jgi:REP element-mobilizing transposase RayT
VGGLSPPTAASKLAGKETNGTRFQQQNTRGEQARRLNIRWKLIDMILAYHVVFGTYGFWLPNDPRGSWSDFVASWELVQFGKATKTTERRSLAHSAHDHRLRDEAKRALKYPSVTFSGRQAQAVAQRFDRARTESSYVIYACSILPEHVHLVIGRNDDRRVERMVGHLKARATQQLSTAELLPTYKRPVWGENVWKVFLNAPAEIVKSVRYVEENPVKEGKPKQRWSFVVPLTV